MLDADPRAAPLAGAVAAVALLAVAVVAARPEPIPFAVIALAAIHLLPEGERGIPAWIYGAALLLCAELAYWSLEERVPRHAEPGLLGPRFVTIVVVVGAGIIAGALVLEVADGGAERSPGLTALGAAAAVACVALLAALARR